MYKISKNLKYPLNLLEDAIGFLGNETKFSCGKHGEAVEEDVRERSIEEIFKDFGINADKTFFKWLDGYIEREFGSDVKLMFDKRYKDNKSLRQVQKETGFSPSVIENRIRRFGSRICYIARDYKKEMGK